MNDINKLYSIWKEKAVKDKAVAEELKEMENNSDAISEAFYKDLEFGTAGLRGIIGAGTNRLNIYTIGKASQGLAPMLIPLRKTEKLQSPTTAELTRNYFQKQPPKFLRQTELRFIYTKNLCRLLCSLLP